MSEKYIEDVAVAEEMAYIEAPFRDPAINAIKHTTVASEAYFEQQELLTHNYEAFGGVALESLREQPITVSKLELRQFAKEHNFGASGAGRAWRGFASYEARRISQLDDLSEEFLADLEIHKARDRRAYAYDLEHNIYFMYLGRDTPPYYEPELADLDNFTKNIRSKMGKNVDNEQLNKRTYLTKNGLWLLEDYVEYKTANHIPSSSYSI